METTVTDTVVAQKTRELCETIVNQPEFGEIRKRIDSFLGDEDTKRHFQQVNEKGEYLHHKQQQGVSLTEEEVADFERERDVLLNNPLARGFLDAQEEIRKTQESVNRYVAKTFELGRVPEGDDMAEGGGSCGSGCGCH